MAVHLNPLYRQRFFDSCWNSSPSSVVATGNSPPWAVRLFASEIVSRRSPNLIRLRNDCVRLLFDGGFVDVFSLLITVWVTPKIACGVGAITAFLFYGGFFGFPNGAICQRVAS